MAKRKKQIDLNDLLGALETGVPVTPHDIAARMNLDFSRGSKDRKRLADALEQLQASGMVQQYGQRFMRPKDADIDSTDFLIGVVEKGPDGRYFKPLDPEIEQIAVTNLNVENGAIVTVRPNACKTGIDRVLIEHGNMDDAHALSLMSALEAHIPIEFPQDVLDETIDMHVPSSCPGRRDMTKIPFLTIDPKTAKDKDDAICVRRKKGGGWTVMVAIADVSHYVRPGTRLFEEALKRGTSVYLPGMTIPMLPETLSNGICSLKPGENRAAIVTTITIDKDGAIEDYKTEKAIIRSRAELDYDQVQDAIDGLATGKVRELYNKYILKAEKACKALMCEAEKRGHLDLNVSEQRIDYSQKAGLQISEERNTLSHQIIAMLMIANNRVAVQAMEQKDKAVLSRAHGDPHEKQYNRFIADLEKMGIVPNMDLDLPDRIRDMTRQSHGIKKHGEKIRQMLIRMQDRARYAVGKLPHYGLALKDGYTHFTSPIRRFSDLVVHCLITDKDREQPEFFTTDNLKDVAKHINMTERRAEQAERRAKDRTVAQWVSKNMSAVFNARVHNVDADAKELEVRGLTHAIHAYIPDIDTSNYRAGQIVQISPREADPVTGIVQFALAANKNTGQTANDNMRDKGQKEVPSVPERKKAPRKKEMRAKRYG